MPTRRVAQIVRRLCLTIKYTSCRWGRPGDIRNSMCIEISYHAILNELLERLLVGQRAGIKRGRHIDPHVWHARKVKAEHVFIG